jgi:hypothetical protein
MSKRYTALRIIGTVYEILGVAAGILTVLAVIGISVSTVVGRGWFGRGLRPGPFYGMGMVGAAIVALIYGGIVTVTLYAFGEGIYLLIALEENTRLTSQLLERQQSSQLRE